ncbi:MAG TPA: hypothetical protein VHX59_09535 [Mycobacteriales bacterium]|jgi:hypothetical protein|nr:hypothetical protein [Mycobacteriales bacterium]
MTSTAGHRRALPGWRSLLLFVAVAVLLDYRALPDPAHRLFDPWTDPSQTTWFFSSVAHALFSGRNPLVTNYLQYPSGINLMWNAAMPLLGVIAAPVTFTLGPVVSYHLLLAGGMALTAWTARLWLGRHVGAPAAIVGGLLFAFSPYSTGQAVYHVGQAVLPFIPLMLMLLEDLLWRRPRRQWISGLLLGGALAGQMLINSETALIALIGIAVVAIVALVLRPRQSVRMLRGTVIGWLGAAVAFLVVAGGPLWQQFRGPHRFHSLTTAMYVAEPRDWVEPTPHLLLNWGHRAHELVVRGLGEHEVGGYFGVPLLVVLVVVGVLLRRRLDLWIALLSLILITVLSLGPRLRLGADLVGPPLPGRLLSGLPVFRNVLPVRLSMAAWLATAFVVALAIDAALRHLAGRTRALALLAVGASLVPVLPAGFASGYHTDVPPFFTSDAVKQIPAGSAVVILPYAETDRARPLLWIAESGTRFRLVGGAAKHPGPGGLGVAPPPTTPVTHWAKDVTNGRTPGPHQRDDTITWARAHGVRYVLVVLAYFPADTVAKASKLVGHQPDLTTGGVAVWKVG